MPMMRWFWKRLAANKATCLNIRNRWYPEPEWPGEIYLEEMRATGGDVLLEIGCGRRARMLHRASDQFRLKIGLDPDCSGQSTRDPSVTLISGDAAALPFPNGSVDVVAMQNVAEHLRDPQQTFRECERILRPNGRLIVHTVNRRFPPILVARSFPHRLRTLFNRIASGTDPEDTFPAFYRANDLRRLRALGKVAGLRPIALRGVTHHPTYLLFSPLLYAVGVICGRGLRRLGVPSWPQAVLQAVFVKPGAEKVPGTLT